MASTRIIAQVTLDRKGNLAADRVVNTYHFEGDSPLVLTNDDIAGAAGGLSNRLITMYQTLAPRLGSQLAGTGRVTLYDFMQAKPRVPEFTKEFTLALTASAPMPAEVALCLSFAGDKASGKPHARRRGRVYLGPWNASQTGNDTVAGDGRPAPSLVALVLQAAGAMVTGGDGSPRLAIYSPTQGAISGQMDEAWNDAKTLWVDDAWDTQRRRGAAPTARTTQAIVG